MTLHSRVKRINEEIREALAQIIMTEVKDPRVAAGLVTVSQVESAKDLKTAHVWISTYGTEEQARHAVDGLNHSKGFIKRLLGQRVILRSMPDLHFEVDNSFREADHINRLLKQTARNQTEPVVEANEDES
ncbi:MAG: 30S ribosome-binding factor RbfA [Candidatus Sumerlaeaceae bacterium]|nr:30S ribosome-binding factor RbfA [Candidatus Sumerlaeaceae bacterium]